MKARRVATWTLMLCVTATAMTLWTSSSNGGAARRHPGPAPIEESMHEFMEYVYQPTYRRLKASIANAPADNSGWKAIKSDSLILAESTNLLFGRGPADEAENWRSQARRVRDAGAKLYAAAKEKDYQTARKSYVGMIQQCNACHQQFADGEYQLEP